MGGMEHSADLGLTLRVKRLSAIWGVRPRGIMEY